jgi:hypothetical protein
MAVGNALRQRAALGAYWRSAAAAAAEAAAGPTAHRIRRPIFIAGLPRTGTTLLQELLAQDPRHRAPQTWELMEPVPPPPCPGNADNNDDGTTAARIARVQTDIDHYKRLAPGIDSFHPIFARRPEECILTMASTFDSQQFAATYNIPSYTRKVLVEPEEHGRAMRWHRRVMETIAQGCTADRDQQQAEETRWILKTPYFLALLDDVRRAYPDATIVHTHRDPAEVLASSASVHAKTYGVVSDRLDLHEIGRQQVDMQRHFLSKAMATRERWRAAAAAADEENKTDFRVVDIHLRDLQSDPMKAVRRLYAEMGDVLTPEAVAAMTQWLARNERTKHGKHKVEKSDFGLADDMAGDPVFEKYSALFKTKQATKI